MTTTITMDENQNSTQENPGLQLARIREQKGYSQEYVAVKLHLRVKVIELLEADDYEQMPEPVFIKGYLRAYAKLLDVAPEPLLATFNNLYATERKLEKALWQSRRESNKSERVVRWFTGLIVVAAIVAVGMWWQKNKDSQQLFTTKSAHAQLPPNKTASEVRLTDLSKMRSMLSTKSTSSSNITPMETNGG